MTSQQVWLLDKKFREEKIEETPYCQNVTKNHSGRLTVAHIEKRRHLTVRWNKRNAVVLCLGCHRHFEDNAKEFRGWLLDNGYTKLELKELRRLASNNLRDAVYQDP